MTLRLGLIGHPVSHSLSPPMHRAALLFFELAGSYELIDLSGSEDEVRDFILAMPTQGFSGFNVTIPHKQTVFNILNSAFKVSREANLLSAVNTVRVDSAGKMSGHNTDLFGFIHAFQECIGPYPHLVASLKGVTPSVVLGSGGAARACIAGLFVAGAQNVMVLVRNVESARSNCDQLSEKLSSYLKRDCSIRAISFEELLASPGDEKFSLLVNCTPVGLHLDEQTPDWVTGIFSRFSEEAFFFDTVYRKDRSATLLMKLASEHGFHVSDGLPMLAHQAALAFDFWTGRQIHAKHMLESLQ